jgi:hypothetical protein
MVNPAAALLVASSAPPVATPSSPAPATPETPTPAPYSTMAPSTGLSHSVLTMDDYEHLLDLVLPVDHRSPPGLEYSLILRFEPHIHPESQIVIRHWLDGRTETVLYRIDQANAWRAAYGNVTEGQTPDFVAMIKQINVVRNSFSVQPSDEAAWRKELLPLLQKDVAKERKKVNSRHHETDYELERGGTRYELWYVEGDNEMHFVSTDSEVDTMTKGNLGLSKWMNQVRSYADSHLASYKPLTYSADAFQPPRKLLAKNKK